MQPDITHEFVRCGLKLIEAFTYPKPAGDPFRRLFKLTHVIETLHECATTEVEREVAKGLRTALDLMLKDAATWSADADAQGVLAFYGADTNLKLLPAKPQKR